jgi:hypothetical protein
MNQRWISGSLVSVTLQRRQELSRYIPQHFLALYKEYSHRSRQVALESFFLPLASWEITTRQDRVR